MESIKNHPDNEPGNKIVVEESWCEERQRTVTVFRCDKEDCNCVGSWEQ